jgi:DNA-binding transcriptional LysR family regulator
MRKQLPFSVWLATKSQLQTWPGRSARCRPAVEIPKRFMRRCFLLTLIPSSPRCDRDERSGAGSIRIAAELARAPHRSCVARGPSIPPGLRAVCTGGVGEGEAGRHDAIVATPYCSFCRRRVQQAFSGVPRKDETDSRSPIQCASFPQVAELVRSGHAVALLPEMVEPNLRKSGVRRLEFAPMRNYHREIGVVWHPRLVSIRPQAGLVLAGLKRIEA